MAVIALSPLSEQLLFVVASVVLVHFAEYVFIKMYLTAVLVDFNSKVPYVIYRVMRFSLGLPFLLCASIVQSIYQLTLVL